MARFLTPLKNEDIDDSTFSRLLEPFRFQSDVLGCIVEAPTGFVHDYESVPLIKATSKRGGVIHDYLCRSDSVPVVTKKQAADVYFEVMECKAAEECKTVFQKFNMWWRRWVKWAVVLIAPVDYFHKHRVMATYEEMAGIQTEEIENGIPSSDKSDSIG